MGSFKFALSFLISPCMSTPAFPLIHRPNVDSYHHQSLVGKKVLILGGERAYYSYLFFRKAREAGVIVYVALLANHERMIRSYVDQDTNPLMHRDFHLLVVPNLFTGPDLESIEEVILEQATAAVAATGDSDSSTTSHACPFFDGCITYQDNHVQLTSDLCNLWGLNGCIPDGVWSTIDKHLFRQKVQELNLGRVSCQRMENFVQDYENGGSSTMNFPLVLKPCTGHGSRGIYLVNSLQEMNEKRTLYEQDFPHRFESWLVEEYLDGPEMGIELIMFRGECYFASVMELAKTPPPFFQGIGRFVPCSLGINEQNELVREAVTVAKLLGLNNTVLDIDAKYISGRGPILLEINCRMGGFSVGMMHQAAFGIDLVIQHIRCGCGLEPDFFVTGGTYVPNGFYYAKMILCKNRDQKGVLRNLTLDGFTDTIRLGLPDEIKSFLSAGMLIVQSGTSVSGGGNKHPLPILAVVAAQGSSAMEALEKANKVHFYASQLVNDCIIPEDSSHKSFAPATDENVRFKKRHQN